MVLTQVPHEVPRELHFVVGSRSYTAQPSVTREPGTSWGQSNSDSRHLLKILFFSVARFYQEHLLQNNGKDPNTKCWRVRPTLSTGCAPKEPAEKARPRFPFGGQHQVFSQEERTSSSAQNVHVSLASRCVIPFSCRFTAFLYPWNSWNRRTAATHHGSEV